MARRWVLGSGAGKDSANLDAGIPAAFQVRLLTLSFSQALNGFDERPLRVLLADQELLSVREHFFQVNSQPYLACLCYLRGRPGRPQEAGRAASSPASSPTARLDPGALILFQSLRASRCESNRTAVPRERRRG